MKLTSEIVATAIIDKDDEENDCIIKMSCEGFETSEVILELPNGSKFKLDADDILESVSRVALEFRTTKNQEDD